MLWGNFDYLQVGGCFVASAMCIQFGDCHELLNSGKGKGQVDWRGFWYGAFFGILPWLIMWFEVGRVFYKYDIPLDVIPWWVWLFFVEYWLLFWCFPINLVYQYM